MKTLQEYYIRQIKLMSLTSDPKELLEIKHLLVEWALTDMMFDAKKELDIIADEVDILQVCLEDVK